MRWNLVTLLLVLVGACDQQAPTVPLSVAPLDSIPGKPMLRTAILRPNLDVGPNQWTPFGSGASSAERVSETTPDITNGVRSGSEDLFDLYGLSDPPADFTRAIAARVFVHCDSNGNYSPGNAARLFLFAPPVLGHGQVEFTLPSGILIPNGSSPATYTAAGFDIFTFEAPTWTRDQLAALTLGMVGNLSFFPPPGGFIEVYTVWLEVDYEVAPQICLSGTFGGPAALGEFGDRVEVDGSFLAERTLGATFGGPAPTGEFLTSLDVEGSVPECDD